MRKEQLEGFRKWFGEYVSSFYGENKYINANLKLKEEHTRKVCEEMIYLAGRLGLDENDTLIAETAALFHDVGRFEQFIKYRTYNDPRSIDHGLLALDILQQYGVLDVLSEQEKQLILTVIKYHGKKDLPPGLDGRSLLHCRLIRDADKLDIFRVVIENYTAYLKNPETFLLEVELPDEDRYSQEIVEAIIKGEKIDYKKLQTLNDMKLLQMGWVFDVNFPATFERIKQRGILEKLASFLPQTPEVEQVKKKVLEFVDKKLNE
jgi:putative nucleotidyltransferase with HDIG domain